MWEIKQGDVLTVLKTLQAESVHCCVTSPPYWGLRAYKTEPQVWGGEMGHEHEWNKALPRRQRSKVDVVNFDSVQAHHMASCPNLPETDLCPCGAWRGELGLEPTPELYVQHLVEVFREVRRVMRSNATLFLNLGDVYFSGAQRGVGSGKRGTASRDCSIGGQSSKSLCDECARTSKNRNPDIDGSRVSTPLVSTPSSTRAHKESQSVRPNNSHSIVQVDHTVNASVNSPTFATHANELPDASRESTPSQSSDIQIQDVSTLPHVVDDPSKLNSCVSCGQQFVSKRVDHDAEDQPTLCSSSTSGQKKNIFDKDEIVGGVVDCTEGKGDVDRGSYLDYSITSHLKPKDLIGMPWRLAFALQSDGWWLRSDIIWAKKNCMPESVQDRPTRSHEYLFLLTKSATYFYDADAIKEPALYSVEERKARAQSHHKSMPTSEKNGIRPAGFKDARAFKGKHHQEKQRGHSRRHAGFNDRWDSMSKTEQCTGFRNKRDVWWLATEPFADAHFAVFPEALVEPCLRAGSKTGDMILDPFCGSGTVGVVALKLQRNFLGIELNPDYVAMARRRIGDVMPLFA